MGKSTAEEVELYLEMQGELEGTAVSPLQEEEAEEIVDEDLLRLELDEMRVEDDTDVSMEDNFPWTSVNPILRLRGPVASGYGRGGKKLGVPTANVRSLLFGNTLDSSLFGFVYTLILVDFILERVLTYYT